jgi:ABC-type sugar transport system permease subunit
MLASLLFEKRTGLINRVLEGVLPFDPEVVGLAGRGGIPWLDLPWLEVLVMPMLILTALWLYVGFNMVYFLAALQNVDRSLEEAAMLDGASRAQRFAHVTIPAIRPVALFVVLLSVIGSVQLFELPYIIYGQTDLGASGPQDRALTLVMYLYRQAFEAGDLGYASAIGWMIAVFLFAIAAGQVALSRGAAR